ncbi:adenylate/guanylate cyclase domain-containing protein [Microbacterium sp. CFBP 8794]|uniref:adenylate/guanylate cyclase domain-containing protein n=1 Tax=Microbacterium sp. CFBP 8794 TaxID=2775269 RepID=UPI00177EA774|nr:adenylate/guanylate cyclase domain-containing protein [Microbacterium sp. CFBP 8794]MBD8479763.1 adenylate/guanylate cyclase domain-containing protein [Microbacterium sp. CFBP 8794]
MTLAEELSEYAKNTHQKVWTRRKGQIVPSTDDITMGNQAVDLDAVVLYADLKDSTGLVDDYSDEFASEIYKNYLYAVSKIIKANGGTITAFDGDRVMAVYIGDSKNSAAARTALRIKWAVDNILQPAIQAQYTSNSFKLRQKVGIASSQTMVSRTGIRGSNDLVWVGNAANFAAKLAAFDRGYSSYLTEAVYDSLNAASKYGGDPQQDMWTDLGVVDDFGRIYASSWEWSFS